MCCVKAVILVPELGTVRFYLFFDTIRSDKKIKDSSHGLVSRNVNVTQQNQC